MRYTLAFDIERSGCSKSYDTIAIFASIIDQNFNELDNLFLTGYFPKETKFEKRCWDEFWIKNQDFLKKLEYKGNLTYKERQKEMIVTFQEFRKKWERNALDKGFEIDLVSDGCIFDAGFINDMLYDYLPNVLPIPYSAYTQDFSPFYDTTSEIKGLLSVIDPTFTKNWGYFNRLKEIYDIEKYVKYSYNNPINDAYNIALQHQILLNIKDNKILKK